MPDMTTGTGVYKKRRIDQTLMGVSQALDNGDSVLMYPSGKLMRSSLELLGAASGVKRALESCENIQIVLVRTRGYGVFRPPKQKEELRILLRFTSWILGSS